MPAPGFHRGRPTQERHRQDPQVALALRPELHPRRVRVSFLPAGSFCRAAGVSRAKVRTGEWVPSGAPWPYSGWAVSGTLPAPTLGQKRRPHSVMRRRSAMSFRRYGTALLVLSALGLAGCAGIGLALFGVGAGISGGTGVNYTLDSVAYKTFAASEPDLRAAT